MSPAPLPLSVAIIAQNEELRLPECLASCSFADEIVVVDSGSTDRTVAIAQEAGARVFVEPWLGFGRQKQLAIDRCANDWVLVVDADERVPPETAAEIRAAMLANAGAHAAFALPRRNIFLNRWIRHAGWWPDPVVRLIDRRRCAMSPDPVHEGIVAQGPVGRLAHPLVHLATRDLGHSLAKLNRYSTIGAQELQAKGRRVTYAAALGRGLWAFLYNYLFRLGFLDGGEGFVIAVTDGANKLFKYAKAKALQDNPPPP